MEFYKECFLNDSIEPIKASEDVEEVSLEKCNYVESGDRSMKLENDNECSNPDESNGFIGDPDIINPEIMFNINLNEHYNQMGILVKQISETPDNLTVLNVCLKFTISTSN